jgi:hypothetical protein
MALDKTELLTAYIVHSNQQERLSTVAVAILGYSTQGLRLSL